MTVRQILARLWVDLENETGEGPSRIDLPPNVYERLLSEFKSTHVFEVPDGFLVGPMNSIVLNLGSRGSLIVRQSSPSGGSDGE